MCVCVCVCACACVCVIVHVYMWVRTNVHVPCIYVHAKKLRQYFDSSAVVNTNEVFCVASSKSMNMFTFSSKNLHRRNINMVPETSPHLYTLDCREIDEVSSPDLEANDGEVDEDSFRPQPHTLPPGPLTLAQHSALLLQVALRS